MFPEVTPGTPVTPAAAAATPAPTPQAAPETQVATLVPTDPFDPAYLQARIDAHLTRKKEEAAPAAAAVAAPAAAAAVPVVASTPADAAPAADASATPAVDAAAAAAPAADAAPVADASAPDAALIVELPSRNAGQEPLRIAAPDKATADALRRLQNGYTRGEEARALMAKAQEREAQATQLEIALRSDPLSVIERIPEAQRAQVARQVLAEYFDTLRPEIEAWWQDDSARRLARAEGLEARNTARQSYESQIVVQQAVTAVRSAVETMIPDGADPQDAQEFYQESLRYLASVAETRPNGMVSAQEVGALLARQVRRYGFVPSGSATASAPSPASAPAPSAQPAPASQTSVSPQAVQRVQAITSQRAAAAATTTVGAGATPVTALPKPPKGASIEQVADFYAAHFKNRA